MLIKIREHLREQCTVLANLFTASESHVQKQCLCSYGLGNNIGGSAQIDFDWLFKKIFKIAFLLDKKQRNGNFNDKEGRTNLPVYW